jgi:hypothetical protein
MCPRTCPSPCTGRPPPTARSLYDDDELRSFYEYDITNLEVEDREAITFESWLEEYLLHGVFYEENEENEDAR